MHCHDERKDLLKACNLKNTRQRSAIIEVLEDGGEPMSAEAIYLKLKEDNVAISLSTVYRVLDTLVEKELALRNTVSDDNKAVYELNRSEHRHHLLCVRCRKMLPVDGCPLDEYERLLEKRFGFCVKGHKLEVFGYCQSCRQAEE